MLAAQRKMSADEFLVWERAQPTKHQYIDGEIYAMSGGTIMHAYLQMQMGRVLRVPQRCKVFGSELMIHIPSSGSYVYPDASVICGPIEHREGSDAVTNPRVVVEVLSKSTESHDRDKKWRDYQSIDSLSDYLLVSQHEQRVEHYRRSPAAQGDEWVYRVYTAGDVIKLGDGATLSIDELYEGASEIPVREE